ncbi:MAG: LEPR-XLL domain-containing protein, partial [Notoacmeibacter sp.]|nr:LEPR-XLL domain-containing protein [Notoacmeibacter sp.]
MAGKRIPAKTQRGTEGTRTPRPGIAMPEALEPRVLLDAAMVETAADLARDVSHDGAPAHDAGDIAELAAALAAPV